MIIIILFLVDQDLTSFFSFMANGLDLFKEDIGNTIVQVVLSSVKVQEYAAAGTRVLNYIQHNTNYFQTPKGSAYAAQLNIK